jgi:hypothetical protein
LARYEKKNQCWQLPVRYIDPEFPIVPELPPLEHKIKRTKGTKQNQSTYLVTSAAGSAPVPVPSSQVAVMKATPAIILPAPPLAPSAPMVSVTMLQAILKSSATETEKLAIFAAMTGSLPPLSAPPVVVPPQPQPAPQPPAPPSALQSLVMAMESSNPASVQDSEASLENDDAEQKKKTRKRKHSASQGVNTRAKRARNVK